MTQKNLVIVESPAKAKTIETFLGKDYKVLSSYGHIRDLKKKDLSIDTSSFAPEYEIPEDKLKVVNELKQQAKKADMVWLASDEDREGEAISWHLYEVLGLTPERSNRIVFHEITKRAITEAIEHPRAIDKDLVDAQQARRLLDRIVGFKLSPILWRKVKPQLSAGRVQSVTVRLLVEREREINAFVSEPAYRVNAVFKVISPKGTTAELKTKLNKTFQTQEEALMFLGDCQEATYTIEDVATRPVKRTPAPPFTTSTLQQEAARKLGYSVTKTMMLAQHLYEAGLITYMRTDSVNLSDVCLNACGPVIKNMMGDKYVKRRSFYTKSKGAQEAHEAIRPTDVSREKVEAPQQEQRLYNLIWKRTIAGQMADAQLENTTVNIAISGREERFVATGQVVIFDGFLKVYRESQEQETEDSTELLPPLQAGQALERVLMTATERFSQHPPRYTEASLVHKLEELGIGRPSTYAPTINVIQQREYAIKGDKEGIQRQYHVLTLKGNDVTCHVKKEVEGNEKTKLFPTDIGIVVNDFLTEHFPAILDYNFTANVEKQFDEIAEGQRDWVQLMRDFYEQLEPQVKKTLAAKTEYKVGERHLGEDPKTGKPVFVKIGRYGPIVQLGAATEEEKPTFASLPKNLSMEHITLEEAMDLFKLPRTLGLFEELPIVANVGRFGPYVLHAKKYTSIPKGMDPLDMTLEQAVTLIQNKRIDDANKVINVFDQIPEIQVLNGRFGPYIACDGHNYKLTKEQAAQAAQLSLEDCLAIMAEQKDKPTTKRKGGRKTTKK